MLILATLTAGVIGAQEQFWFITGREGGTRAANNQVTLREGQNFIYVYFRGDMNPVGGEFDRMRINFQLSEAVEVIWQAVYYQDMMGGVLGSEESTGVRNSGPIETNFSRFNLRSSGRVTELPKQQMNGFCLAINVPRGTRNVTFTMNSVEFIGLVK